MSRKRIGLETPSTAAKKDLVEKLVDELKSNRAYGQPVIFEQTFRTGKVRVTVIWDAWDGTPPQRRSATILRAYEVAEGAEARDRIALVSGLTVPEAHAAGMLPYQIITALRKGDPVTDDQARQAMLDESASRLTNPPKLQLRFATEEDAEASRQRLLRRFPGSDDVWIILREVTAEDSAGMEESTRVEEV